MFCDKGLSWSEVLSSPSTRLFLDEAFSVDILEIHYNELPSFDKARHELLVEMSLPLHIKKLVVLWSELDLADEEENGNHYGGSIRQEKLGQLIYSLIDELAQPLVPDARSYVVLRGWRLALDKRHGLSEPPTSQQSSDVGC